jgi:hypothetical protein
MTSTNSHVSSLVMSTVIVYLARIDRGTGPNCGGTCRG